MFSILTPPTFSDPEREQSARALHFILLSFLVASLFLIVGAVISRVNAVRWMTVIALVYALCLPLVVMNRRGLTVTAGIALIVGLWAMVTGLAFTAGGIRSTVSTAYLIIIFIGGLLFSTRGGILTAVLCTLSGLGLVLMEVSGYIPPNTITHTPWTRWVSHTIFAIIILCLQALASSAVARALHQTRKELKERTLAEEALREGEARFRALVENAPEAIVVLDMDKGVFDDLNENACRLFKLTRKEMMTRNPVDLSPPVQPDGLTSAESAMEKIQRAIAGENPRFEWMHRNSRGEDFPCEVYLARLPSPTRVLIRGSIIDISDRKKTLDSLQRSEERFRRVIEATNDGIWEWDIVQDKVVWTDRVYEMFKMPKTSFPANFNDVKGLVHDDDVSRFLDVLEQHLKNDTPYSLEIRFRCGDGTYGYYLCRGKASRDKAARPLNMIGSIEDVTARKQAEERLRESEERFRGLSSAAYEGIMIHEGGRILDANQAFADIFGFSSPAELIGKNGLEMLPFTPESRELIRQRVRTDTSESMEISIIRPDGSLVFAETQGRAVTYLNRKARVVAMRDITRRKGVENALRASEARYRAVVEHQTEFIVRWTPDGKRTFVNEAYLRCFGLTYEEAINSSFMPLVAQEHRQSIEEKILRLTSGTVDSETEIHRSVLPDGRVVWQEWTDTVIRDDSGNVKELQSVGRDITERKNAEQALRTSESQFRELWESTVEGIVIHDKGIILEVNDAMCRMFGVQREQCIGESLLKFAPTEVHGLLRERIGAGIDGRFETPALRADGTELFIEVFAKQILFRGQTVRMVATRDITERKQAEKALKESEERLRATVNNTPYVAVQWYDEEGRVTFWNHASERIFGWKAEEALGKTLDQTIHTPEGAAEFLQVLGKIKRTGKPVGPVEYEFKSRDGSTGVCLSTTFMIPSAGGKSGFVCMDVDVTERRRAEEQNILFAQTLKSTQDCISITDLDNKILFANEAFLSLYGYTERELFGQNISTVRSFKVPTEESKFILSGTMEGGWHGEVINRRKDGTEFPVELWTSLVKNQAGVPVAMVGVARDITERRQAQMQIEQQAKLLDVAQDAIVVRDIRDKLLYMNRAAEQLYGWTFDEGQRIRSRETIVEADREKFDRDLQTFMEAGEWEGQVRQRSKAGAELIVETRWTMVRDSQGKPSARLIINRDVTEQRKLEVQLRRTQRLESLGTLAGGIAHDLNNVLAPIMMSTALLQRQTQDPTLKKWISALETSAERGTEIIKQVLMFARGSEKGYARQQIRYVVREIATMVNQTFPKNIELRTRIPADLNSIMGDATQLHQLLMNLCVNARDAMPEGGQIVIAASNVTLGETDMKLQTEAHPGSYVLLSVSDSGSGIPKELQEKIFEPFFTTKEVGKGTGLGLSTVYAIVKDHNGFLNLYSEIGKGTEFKVYIPAVQHLEEAAVPQPAKVMPSGNGELILVVDDEQSVLQITKGTLEMYGYKVITAENGVAAIALLESLAKGSVHLVISDVNMPKMNGPTAIRAMRKFDPALKVVMASGLLTELDQVKLKDLDFQAYLTKPYTAERMLNTVHEVLTGRNGTQT